MNLRNLTLLTLLFIVLCGCDDNKAMLNSAIEQAEKVADPVDSYYILREAEIKNEHSLFHSESDFYTALSKYKLLAAAKLDPLALQDLYVYPNIELDEVSDAKADEIRSDEEALRIDLAPAVVALAENSKNYVLQSVAAYLYDEGEYVVQDTLKSIEHSTSAWMLGDIYSARYAANQYLKFKDYKNAYLWSLRCLKPCYAYNSVANLEKELTPEEIKLTQKQAKDRSVLKVNSVVQKK